MRRLICLALCGFSFACAAAADYRERLAEDEIVYFVLPDRFENGDPSNDRGGLAGGRLSTGFDPAHKGFYHGGDLKGLGPVPPLAGRSPSYTVRQLFDLQQGVRKGTWSALMKAAVEKLTIDDMIAIAAYTSSREP